MAERAVNADNNVSSTTSHQDFLSFNTHIKQFLITIIGVPIISQGTETTSLPVTCPSALSAKASPAFVIGKTF